MRAEYIDHMGDDLTVVDSARVSFNKESDWEYEWDGKEEGKPYDGYGISGKHLKKTDEKLILYLARHNHWTPFSHCQITLRETVPIFVARQRFKHMVGFTYNEVSRRYVQDTPEFYSPGTWHFAETDRKQGTSNTPVPDQSGCTSLYTGVLQACADAYRTLLEKGVAPEEARMVLPQSMYTSYYVTGSLAAWARAYKLRIDTHAQKEIQYLAKQWDSIIRPLYPVSWEALTAAAKQPVG